MNCTNKAIAQVGGRRIGPPPLDGDSPRPLFIGSRNCEAMIGLSWRYVLGHAEGWGVTPIRVGGKRVIPADALLAALETQGVSTPARPIAPEAGSPDEYEAMRLRVLGGGQ